MAVTGPFVEEIYIQGLIRQKMWFRQTKPFKNPLGYRNLLYQGWYSDSVTGDKRKPTSFTPSPAYQEIFGVSLGSTNDAAYAKAYDALVNRMKRSYESASMGVTVAESKSSWTMINDRLGRLIRLQKALRRQPWAVPQIMGELLLTEKNAKRLKKSWPSRKAVANDFASSYLELIFGWMPLVKDIQDCINVLQNPPKAATVFGQGSDEVSWYNTSTPPWLPATGWLKDVGRMKTERRLQCLVSISNPNLDLANRLGFVNLPAVAYELIPGSFLLDWFIPVGRFLESYSDFVGRSVTGAFMSTKRTVTHVLDSNYAGVAGRGLELQENEGSGFLRSVPLSLVTPGRFRGFTLPTRGLQSRAITLFALFTQSFSK